MQCNQENCTSEATHLHAWPGSGEAAICDAHLRKARDVARAMGFLLPVKRIETPYNATASKPSVRCEQCGAPLPAIEVANVRVNREDVDMKGATLMIALSIECACGERCGSIISRTFTEDATVADVVAEYAAARDVKP